MCVLMGTDGHTRTATDVLFVLADTHRRLVCADGHKRTHTDCHGRPVCADGQPRTSCVCWRTPTDVMGVLNRQPTLAKSPKQSTGRASVLSTRANVLTCVLMDSHRRPVCADGHRQTHTDVLCVLTDTHGRHVCTEHKAHVGQNHPNSPREGKAC